MNAYRLAAFDLDGTILNTLDDLAAATNHVLSENGLPLRSTEEVRSFVGNGIRKLIERAVPEGSPESLTEQLYREFLPYYQAHCFDRTLPYPGIPEALQKLKEEGYLLAVLSNKADPAVQELCDRYFPALFDFSAGERPGVPKKPAPDALLSAIRELGVAPGETVYIGDSDVDIATAKNAGVPCISVYWGFRSLSFLKEHGAGATVGTPEELLKRLLAL